MRTTWLIGDNEAGLLFASDAQAQALTGRQLRSGGRYLGLEPVAPGVYFFTSERDTRRAWPQSVVERHRDLGGVVDALGEAY